VTQRREKTKPPQNQKHRNVPNRKYQNGIRITKEKLLIVLKTFLLVSKAQSQAVISLPHPHLRLAGGAKTASPRTTGKGKGWRTGSQPVGRGPQSEEGAHLDAPVPKEKPPPVTVPPAAKVVEPSVPDPKENPVDMPAPGSTRRRSGTHSRFTAEVGQAPSLSPSGNFKPQRLRSKAEVGVNNANARPHSPRAPSTPEASPSRREPWDGDAGEGGRPAAQGTLGRRGVGARPTLLKG
jgi:hypothetical protein